MISCWQARIFWMQELAWHSSDISTQIRPGLWNRHTASSPSPSQGENSQEQAVSERGGKSALNANLSLSNSKKSLHWQQPAEKKLISPNPPGPRNGPTGEVSSSSQSLAVACRRLAPEPYQLPTLYLFFFSCQDTATTCLKK